MLYHLPPLNSLRSFEAAARHLSFKKAAEELNVTPGAISQQVKRLEANLSTLLFLRTPTSLQLTQAGQEYLPVIRRAFERISEATERLQVKRGIEVVTVSTMSGFASKWLVPRLSRFRELHPNIDVRISTSWHLVDFGREDVDVAIRHGLGRYQGLRSWRLLVEDMVPVCSPKLQTGRPALRTLADLGNHTLLHDEERRDWSLWLEAAGVTGIDGTRGLSFSEETLMLEAAIEGQGIALGRSALIERDLAEGRLVKPFDVQIPNEFAYYLVCPGGRAKLPKIVALREWLLQEVGQRKSFDPSSPGPARSND